MVSLACGCATPAANRRAGGRARRLALRGESCWFTVGNVAAQREFAVVEIQDMKLVADRGQGIGTVGAGEARRPSDAAIERQLARNVTVGDQEMIALRGGRRLC